MAETSCGFQANFLIMDQTLVWEASPPVPNEGLWSFQLGEGLKRYKWMKRPDPCAYPFQTSSVAPWRMFQKPAAALGSTEGSVGTRQED